ncbi:MAG: division plane positioning ATPase MipZ [Hyphomicrobiales bacterium]|nr:division plane positioning ATPase MipZ [Hyphomicrobiales bacterium]OQW83406.1 MAG: hypothetical protein BVN31_05980 [Proteobacteria bacterium ST_bin15]
MHGTTPRSCHIIVVGNEKGGSGKTTTAINIAVALMHDGFRVATIDLDSRQRSLSRFIAHRQAFADTRAEKFWVPTHRSVTRSEQESRRASIWADYEAFAKVIGEVERSHDCIVIDTPGHDSTLTRAAHSAADTLITPLNDSFIDLEVLADVKAGTRRVVSSSHYTNMVLEAQRERRAIDAAMTDWVVVRNRVAVRETRNQRWLMDAISGLSREFGFRIAGQVADRVIFRELFPLGLTALDPLETLGEGMRPSMSHLAARLEVRHLVSLLRIPGREQARQRLEARDIFAKVNRQPLSMMELSQLVTS